MKTQHREVRVRVGAVALPGMLGLPAPASGIVVFAHGTGSGRLSPRNRYVAGVLEERGMNTLLFDLLTEAEADDRAKVFDIELLAERLVGATQWLRDEGDVGDEPVGYFGASTGAAAALVAAARLSGVIAAVVSRGGRPDLAAPSLPDVKAPTLLIVGGYDLPVIPLNESALERLGGLKDLVIVPGAGHLFEEPGTLEEVARLAADWFGTYLRDFAWWSRRTAPEA